MLDILDKHATLTGLPAMAQECFLVESSQAVFGLRGRAANYESLDHLANMRYGSPGQFSTDPVTVYSTCQLDI